MSFGSCQLKINLLFKSNLMALLRRFFLLPFFYSIILMGLSQWCLAAGEKASIDTASIFRLYEKSFNLRSDNPQEGIRLATELLTLSEKTGYEAGKGYAYQTLGACKITMGRNEEAIEDLKIASEIFDSLKRLSALAKTENQIGIAY